jgi:hypothetical protein
MREIRLSGSEGGGTELNRFSLPLLAAGSPFHLFERDSHDLCTVFTMLG